MNHNFLHSILKGICLCLQIIIYRERQRQKQRDYHTFLKIVTCQQHWTRWRPAFLYSQWPSIATQVLCYLFIPIHHGNAHTIRSSLGNLVDTQCCPALDSNSCSCLATVSDNTPIVALLPTTKRTSLVLPTRQPPRSWKIQDVPCPE